MITTISRQGGRRYPQMRSAWTAHKMLEIGSATAVSLYGWLEAAVFGRLHARTKGRLHVSSQGRQQAEVVGRQQAETEGRTHVTLSPED